ncbi:hypothetical protein [Xylophilus sp. GOD-11R]|uniref:hypothetical protein n=1 Tax=Xylophilus sp. GOD-11R TaxID=3089814 RepID=UPI00298CD729|nr:hypothetical protein [Xylophilus sp. GOD-11R]WPB58863.1 hypothetical protein R9X41_09575 [Xylophilus sp. GOD-11R]
MYFPLFIDGFTLFPTAMLAPGGWEPKVRALTGRGEVAVIDCEGSYPSQAIAVAFARIEAGQVARVLKETCGHFDCERP